MKTKNLKINIYDKIGEVSKSDEGTLQNCNHRLWTFDLGNFLPRRQAGPILGVLSFYLGPVYSVGHEVGLRKKAFFHGPTWWFNFHDSIS